MTVRPSVHVFQGPASLMIRGTSVTVRAVRAEDEQLQRAFFRALSRQSRYFRFMTHLEQLPDVLAQRFTRIDYIHHFALLATVRVDGQERMIAEARFIGEENDPSCCEFAIAVADAWQQLNIGLYLLEQLELQARASGYRRIVAGTLASNRSMLGLAVRAGYAIDASPPATGEVRLTKWVAQVVASAA